MNLILVTMILAALSAQPAHAGQIKSLTRGAASVGAIHIADPNGLVVNGTAITATPAEVNVLDGVTAGTVTASKALVVDGSKDLGDLGSVTVGALVGGDSSLGITGVAGDPNSAGGAVAITGGAGDGTGAGGAASLVGGASGDGATGNGGAAMVAGGASASTNGDGGAMGVFGGAATGTGTGGSIAIISGASAGASGTAGAVTISAGDANGGTAGTITIGSNSNLVLTDDEWSVTGAGVASFAHLRTTNNAELSASDVNLTKAQIQAAGYFPVMLASNIVDVDFGDDAALDGDDIGSRKVFMVATGHATNALTVTAGASGVTTIITQQAGAGSSCEDVGDFIECVISSTTSATCVSYCAD